MSRFSQTLLIALAAFSVSSVKAESCPDPNASGKVTGFATKFVQLETTHCPDKTIGRGQDVSTEGSLFLKGLASNVSFDTRLQTDANLKATLNADKRLKPARAEDSDLRACLNEGLTLKYLLSLDSGDEEGYDIGEHTTRVLDTFYEQKRFYTDVDLKSISTKDIAELMAPILAMHDIGKGIAVKAGDRDLQHVYTSKFLRTYLGSQFTAKEMNLALALVDHDAIGEYLQGTRSLASARKQLQERAKLAGLEYHQFMRLQQLYFTADASSYPMVMDETFQREGNGRLNISDSRFQQLL